MTVCHYLLSNFLFSKSGVSCFIVEMHKMLLCHI